MDRQALHARQVVAQQQLAAECAELQAELISFSKDSTRQQTTYAKQVRPKPHHCFRLLPIWWAWRGKTIVAAKQQTHGCMRPTGWQHMTPAQVQFVLATAASLGLGVWFDTCWPPDTRHMPAWVIWS